MSANRWLLGVLAACALRLLGAGGYLLVQRPDSAVSHQPGRHIAGSEAHIVVHRSLLQADSLLADDQASPNEVDSDVLLQRRKAVANPDVKRKQAEQLVEDVANPDVRQLQEGGTSKIHTSSVLLLTIFMAGAAGLGALPFFFVGSLSKEWAALANAIACGVMLACSFDLMHEGQPYGGSLVVLGILIGAVFISASQQWLENFEEVKFQGLRGLNARKIMLMIGIMAAHAFGEGAGVGVSFCGTRGWAQGVLVTLAIGLHNIPEGLAVSTVLVARGISPRNALLWTLFTSMPQPLVAVPSFLFVDTFRVLLPVALGFAAGCMVWMVFAELLPDALADASHPKVATVGTFSAAWLEGLRMMLATLEGGNGKILMPGILDGAVLASGILLVLPAALAGLAGGKVGGILAKEKSSAGGLAAGILAWQGGADLVNNLAIWGSARALPLTAAAAIGAFAAVLLGRAPSLWPAGPGKEKEGGTPVKANGSFGSQIEVAADQNESEDQLLDSTASLLGREDPNEIDVELAGGTRRVFSPYQPGKKPLQRGLLATGIAAIAIQGLGIGFRISVAASFQKLSASSLWLPTALRGVLPGAAAAALLSHANGARAGVLGFVAALASIAPLSGFLERLHMEVTRQEGEGLAPEISAAASGAALTAGLWMLFPAVRAVNQRRALKGFMKGLLFGSFVYCLLGLLCWTSPYCLR